jgi:CRISPR-associated protein Cas1
MLDEYVYCPRLFHLEWVYGEFEDSADTIEGRFIHRNVDKKSDSFPPPEESMDDFSQIKSKSVTLSSSRYQIIAKMDLVEGNQNEVYPVEFKRGKAPESGQDPWLSDKIQLCAQAIILRENGYKCEHGEIYYNSSKKRVKIDITENLMDQCIKMIVDAKGVSLIDVSPAPLIDSPKCPKCSLVSICLPDETNLEMSEEKQIDVRRLYPARNETFPVYVTKNGCYIGKKGDELDITYEGKSLARAKIMETSQVLIFGYSQISTQALSELSRKNIPVCYFSSGGWFKSILTGMSHKNVLLRIKQFEIYENQTKSIEIARKMISGKIRNCRTMLRRNSITKNKTVLSKLSEIVNSCETAMDFQSLLGFEGMAARIYFQHFKDMFKNEMQFEFEERNRRPPKDPVNALLSYLYAVLTSNVMVTCLSVGFDPYLGFLHRPKYGKPALALDLIEEFRPIICDSVVIGMINTGEISSKDFLSVGPTCAISSIGKKKLINAYERRMDTLVTHPIYGYSVSYRRIIEVQARMLTRVVMGEIREYEPFCTR